MTAGGPRSARGIDPKARAVAEALARQSGISLSEWLTEFLAEEGPEDAVSQDFFNAPAHRAHLETLRTMDSGPSRPQAHDHPADDVSRITQALDRLSARIEAAERRSAAAISGVDETVRSVIHRLDSAEREQADASARFEGAVQQVQHEQIRTADRLRSVEAQVQGPRSPEVLRSLEAALGRVAGHLQDGEGRTHAAIADVRARMERIEAGRVEPEVAVQAIVQRLEDAENRTSVALHDLKASFATLDSRLHSVESAGAPGVEARLEELAATLSSRVDAARAEMAERMRATADTRFDRMERALSEMTDHVRDAETRSTQAIEHMGREVVAIAETLGRRVQSVEHRSAQAIEQVGGDIARMAEAMESRMGRADTVQAQALEKLGQEIARITERLSERIANSERRAAQAIDDVGEQVARVTERISQRHERSSSELADRIQQSEERTAKLLDEAREKLERLASSHGASEAEPPAEGAADEALSGGSEYPGFEPAPSVVEPSFAPRPFRRSLGARFAGSVALAPLYTPQYTPESSPEPITAFRPRPLEQVAFDQEDLDAASALTIGNLALDTHEEELFAQDEESALIDPAPEEAAAADAEPEAWEDVVDAERLAAEILQAEAQAEPLLDEEFDEPSPADVLQAVAAEPAAEAARLEDDEAFDDLDEAEVEPEAPVQAQARRPLTTREVVSRARAASRLAEESRAPAGRRRTWAEADGASLFPPSAAKRGGVSKGAVAMTLTAAASVGVALAGFTMIQSGPQGRLPKRVEDAIALARTKVGEIKFAEAGATPTAPQAAVALGFKPLDPAAQTGAAPAEDLSAAYSAAVIKVETNSKGGLDALRNVANQGYAPAQFYVGKLYEDGTGGVKKDPAEARRWYERAAEAGERKAMHNLAMLYYYGVGGDKNSTTAGQWFRRAADLGLVDSQYNLGQLYEQGFGVSQNPAEAYKWYLIAARSGDADSKASAVRVHELLTANARVTAERAAAAFRIGGASAVATSAPATPATDLVTAQKALSTLGYYQGPTDGVSSPALRLALAAYQHDQGLPATGAADTTTVGKLASLAR